MLCLATSGYHRNGVTWTVKVSTPSSTSLFLSRILATALFFMISEKTSIYISSSMLWYYLRRTYPATSRKKKKILFPLFVLPNTRLVSNWCRKIAINRTITSKLIRMSITVNYEGDVSHRTAIYKLIPSGQGCRPVSCPCIDIIGGRW